VSELVVWGEGIERVDAAMGKKKGKKFVRRESESLGVFGLHRERETKTICNDWPQGNGKRLRWGAGNRTPNPRGVKNEPVERGETRKLLL